MPPPYKGGTWHSPHPWHERRRLGGSRGVAFGNLRGRFYGSPVDAAEGGTMSEPVGRTGAEGQLSPFCAHGEIPAAQSRPGCSASLPGNAPGTGPAGGSLPLLDGLPRAGETGTDSRRRRTARQGAGRTGERSRHRSGGDPPGAPAPDRLLDQREAAQVLAVSTAFLRASNCPKVLLPGNGLQGRPLVRYRLADILRWATARRV